MIEPAEVFLACYAAYLADDWHGLGLLLTDEVVLESPGSPPAIGREAVIGQHRQTKRAIPDIRGEYSEIATVGEMVGGRKLIIGTNTGGISAGGRELPATAEASSCRNRIGCGSRMAGAPTTGSITIACSYSNSWP